MHKINCYAGSFWNYKSRLNNKGLFQRISIYEETPVSQKVVSLWMRRSQYDSHLPHGRTTVCDGNWSPAEESKAQARKERQSTHELFPNPLAKSILMLFQYKTQQFWFCRWTLSFQIHFSSAHCHELTLNVTLAQMENVVEVWFWWGKWYHFQG